MHPAGKLSLRGTKSWPHKLIFSLWKIITSIRTIIQHTHYQDQSVCVWQMLSLVLMKTQVLHFFFCSGARYGWDERDSHVAMRWNHLLARFCFHHVLPTPPLLRERARSRSPPLSGCWFQGRWSDRWQLSVVQVTGVRVNTCRFVLPTTIYTLKSWSSLITSVLS